MLQLTFHKLNNFHLSGSSHLRNNHSCSKNIPTHSTSNYHHSCLNPETSFCSSRHRCKYVRTEFFMKQKKKSENSLKSENLTSEWVNKDEFQVEMKVKTGPGLQASRCFRHFLVFSFSFGARNACFSLGATNP